MTQTASKTDDMPRVQIHVVGNCSHDNVDYVIGQTTFVDRVIADVLIAIGVAEPVNAAPPDDEAAAKTADADPAPAPATKK